MECGICKKETRDKLCTSCRNFLAWIYPDDKPEKVIEKYQELKNAHFHLRRRKKK